jgi:hypothetical protein
MFQADQDGVYAVVAASPMRRVGACAVLYLLGALVIYIAVLPPLKMFFTPFLMGLGGAILWVGERLRRATRAQIILTEDALRDSDGYLIAELSQVIAVDRGAFAMKPSNGFTLKLTQKQPHIWAPGLWWRLGRRVGVGGVTSAGQSKFMAEQIALRIADRDQN